MKSNDKTTPLHQWSPAAAYSKTEREGRL